MKKWQKVSTILAVALGAAVIAFIICRPPAELKELEREFGLELSWQTKLVYGVKSYSSWVDGPNGHAVMVYQLRQKDMPAILQTATAKKWHTLPLNEQDITAAFAQRIPAEDWAEVPLDLSQGLYKVKEGTYEFRRAYDPRSRASRQKIDSGELFSCSLGIIDTTTNKIYLVKWDK